MKTNKKEKPQNLIDLFEKQVQLRPQEIAAIDQSQSISYAEINQKANQLAHYLKELGLEQEMPIGIFMNRNIELLIAILGILKAGGAYVPLDPASPKERLLLILNEGKIPIVVTSNDLLARFELYQGKILFLDEDKKLKNQSKQNPNIKIKPQQLAYIIFTSGSTGKPKGVLIEHRSVVNYANWFNQYSQLEPKDRIDSSSNHSFDLAVSTTIIPLVLGLTIVICNEDIKKDPKLFFRYLENYKISCIKVTPGFFNVLLHQAKLQRQLLPHLKKIVLGGENLSAQDCVSWFELYPHHHLFNEYGPTETTVGVTVYSIEQKNSRTLLNNTVPIGRLMPHCSAYILDEEGNPVDDGAFGELHLGGLCLARGYLNDKQLTEKRFIKNPFSKDLRERLYKTGDLCRKLSQDLLECKGRIDDQIKIRGFRIEPGEIERRLSLHPEIKSAVVSAVEGNRKEKYLVAYYSLKNPQKNLEEKALRQYLRRYLPEYMIPAVFYVLESFPLTANEKIDRKALIPPHRSLEVHQLPTNALESSIAEIWSKELGFGPIDVKSNFFDLGGHSLSAARIISTISHVLAKDLSLDQFYRHPTIKELSNWLAKKKKSKNHFKFSKSIYEEKRQLPLSNFQFTLWLSMLFEPKVSKYNIVDRRRFVGHLNEYKLKKAFKYLQEKHEVLSYQVYNLSPRQHREKFEEFKLELIDLRSLSKEKAEIVLEKSFKELIGRRWQKKENPLLARCFYLGGEKSELQLAMPHILADEISFEILFSDLSKFYSTTPLQNPKIDQKYRDYLFTEQMNNQQNSDSDFKFWKQYLHDAELFSFPKKWVIKDMSKSNLPFSHYTEISLELLERIKNYSQSNHISLDNILTALILAALFHCSEELNKNKTICFNKVRSTRDDPKYDNTIGCFLSIEPIKIQLNGKQDLNLLCQQIQHSIIRTSPYQGCSNLVKLASISNFPELNKLKTSSLNLFTYIYNMLFPSTPINSHVVKSSAQLNIQRENKFLININILSSFFKNESQSTDYFGLKTDPIPLSRYDLLTINNFLDVCFLRRSDQKFYMVISANLASDFHQLLSEQILTISNSVF